MKYYKLHEAIKAAKKMTKGTNNILYIYSQPSPNGLFVDWIVEGMLFQSTDEKRLTYKIIGGREIYVWREDTKKEN